MKQAFIQANLNFKVLMKVLDDFGDSNGKVVKIIWSVYGLKEAGCRWTMCLGKVIVRTMGIKKCQAGAYVFRLTRDDLVVMTVCVHVANIIVVEEFEG